MRLLRRLWRVLLAPRRAARLERHAIRWRAERVHIRVNQLVEELDGYDQDIGRERHRP